jgi:hypothetical protein
MDGDHLAWPRGERTFIASSWRPISRREMSGLARRIPATSSASLRLARRGARLSNSGSAKRSTTKRRTARCRRSTRQVPPLFSLFNSATTASQVALGRIRRTIGSQSSAEAMSLSRCRSALAFLIFSIASGRRARTPGLPGRAPRAIAALSPLRVRAAISSRSSSATAARIWMVNTPLRRRGVDRIANGPVMDNFCIDGSSSECRYVPTSDQLGELSWA